MDDKIILSNKEAWNEATHYHQVARKNALHEKFEDPDFVTYEDNYTDNKIVEIIKNLNLENKKVAHIQTNNGRELISLMRVTGADEGVGFDISDEAIKEARELTAIAKVNARYECVNIYDIPESYNNYFHMIYITEGSLSWLPDMKQYFRVMSDILKTGGSLLISEIHPVGFALDEDTETPVHYDRVGPYKMTSGLDYVGEVDYTPKDCYWYMHKMSDIIMAMIDNGFEIQLFEESTIDTGWIDPNDEHPTMPRSFVLLARKK